ncbi:TPA: N-acetylmuramoyl-L-alanine amidase [Staphylococcus aureus]|uniref:N-acetylmuramoyl-L-alanine amidase n=2 Tax=Staphylococcus aureus TaxID=1280 RepID=UPI0001B3AB90|nr:N-acetylmuramoyl-L-alanine amidase [Staphylococcus aureus]EEV78568.1 amidase [Staphylococcus aureus A6300]EJX2114215.1 N-acetylmuramoyl-L-alanine amidase [Staphylococcus aureus]EJX2291411.1 N-acetylmuramoyl-L-alanine amidase [Staphylococcus aureus]ENK49085.1 phage amidase [Staphylococcus aureus M0528]ENL06668.1 phage amidase [Staphylococcus aureus M0687]
MLITKNQAEKWFDNSLGKQFNPDLFYGFQCYDYANMFFMIATGERLQGLYAYNIPFDNKARIEKYGQIIKNYDSFLPQKLDIVVFPSKYGGGAGHVEIVESANLNTFTSFGQNWNGKGWTNGVAQPGWGPETVTRHVHYYDDPMYFIRLNFPDKVSVGDKAKSVIKQATAKKQAVIKPKKIMLVAGHGYNDPGAVGNGTNERDFIRKYITPNIAKYLRHAGHEVALYGGSSQSQDMYQDTAYGVNVGNKKDYGLYWVKSQGYDIVLEIHLDAAGESASGGHVIISSQFNADTIDKSIQDVIKNNLGQIRGVTPRNDLLNVNVSAEINMNYRLSELGFITNKKDMDWIKKNYDLYSKLIAGAIHGKPIGGLVAGNVKTSAKNQKNPPVPAGYTPDKNNVPYKKETGYYTVANVKGNNVRDGYSTNSRITGVLPNNTTITYDGAYCINGYRWITYIANSGQRRYIATGEVDKAGNRISSFGKFSTI